MNSKGYIQSSFRAILSANRSLVEYESIGVSRTGLPLEAIRLGQGTKKISLIGGMHAEEPAGPMLLRYLSAFLTQLDPSHALLTEFQWWILPHGNPDGEERNQSWFHHTHHTAEVGRFLAGSDREKPGDDLEFGFPRSEADQDARPETRAIYRWWSQDRNPFLMHASLHGMAFAGGAWFLLPRQYPKSLKRLQYICTEQTANFEYLLHDVERNGEKGFHRIAPGFCTHPNSQAMQEYFLSQDDKHTAALFRPSSMETIESFGGTPLTLVSEIPLFILPGVGVDIGPPDPVAFQWQEQIAIWKQELRDGIPPDTITLRAESSGIIPVPYDRQMQLQWAFLLAGLTVSSEIELPVLLST